MKKNTMRILDRQGQGLTEYMILLVLVSLAAVGVTQGLGKSVKNTIKKARERIDHGIVFKEKGKR
jgi:Flp pilus assembly pilin Flp